MSENEQIITQPEEPKKKDPKKVAAGKALAKKNKEAREAKRKLDEQQQQEDQGASVSLFDNIRNASILVSSGFVLYHGYKCLYPDRPQVATRPQKVYEPRPQKEENSIEME